MWKVQLRFGTARILISQSSEALSWPISTPIEPNAFWFKCVENPWHYFAIFFLNQIKTKRESRSIEGQFKNNRMILTEQVSIAKMQFRIATQIIVGGQLAKCQNCSLPTWIIFWPMNISAFWLMDSLIFLQLSCLCEVAWSDNCKRIVPNPTSKSDFWRRSLVRGRTVNSFLPDFFSLPLSSPKGLPSCLNLSYFFVKYTVCGSKT